MNHYIGAFAGITDIQGMDFYVAGCAPHITGTLSTMYITGSYEYLITTRNNHMPLLSWGYTQAFYKPKIHGNEFVTQLISIIAAGNHGVMLFQSDISQKTSNKDTWIAASAMLATISYIQDYLWIGDIDGATYRLYDNVNETMVTIIRTVNELIVIPINTDCYGYSDILCYVKEESHWLFNKHTIPKLEIDIPIDMTFDTTNNGAKVFEVYNGTLLDIPEPEIGFDIYDDVITLSNIKMDDVITARVFVIPAKNSYFHNFT